MPRPNWFDWLTLAAIFLGPIFALLAQRALDWLREKQERRVKLYTTLMSVRATPLHPDHIRALNSIDAIFDRRGDYKVRDAWGKILAHVATDTNTPGWQNKLLDLRVDLYQAVGKAVGYDHTIDYLKTRIYLPVFYNDIEMEVMQIRKSLAKAITEHGLQVVLVEPTGPTGTPQLQPEASRKAETGPE